LNARRNNTNTQDSIVGETRSAYKIVENPQERDRFREIGTYRRII
jgi:hypothetical protein